jgi:hypothetical protein
MSDDNKINVPEIKNDIIQIHQKEKELFPADIASLSPARDFISDKLIRAQLLKFYQDNLILYDCYKVEDEQACIKKSIKINNKYEGSIAGAPFAFTLYYLLYKRAPILHLNSYIRLIYPISCIFAGTYIIAHLARLKIIQNDLDKISEDHHILNTKAELHTNIIRLSNSLKYPDSDLH